MKIRSFLFIPLILIIGILSSCSESPEPEEILSHTLKKIESLDRVEQILVTEYHDSANYVFKTDTSVYYFIIQRPDILYGAKYHCPGYYLASNKPTKKIQYELATLRTDQFGDSYYKGAKNKQYIPIYGSIDAFRRFIPHLISDSAVRIIRLNDTLINSQEMLYHIQVKMKNRNINEDGKIHQVSFTDDHLLFTYDFFINKRTGLPEQVVFDYKYNGKTSQWWKATTLQYTFSPLRPGKTWDLSYNSQNYITVTDAERHASKNKKYTDFLINKAAPGWEMPSTDHKMYSLEDFSDKLLLIEFFTTTCGPCRRAYPFLNELQAKLDPAEFRAIGINFVNRPLDELKAYVKKAGIDFLVLNDTGQTALKYQVGGAPTFVMIKNGIIIYVDTGYTDNTMLKIMKEIDKNM
ncbi:MAG: TlpA family protein disulfide reductase [Bacteroidales bacterium]|nr:TlpA family protein disulfide reductase [Bacteroidales bacterium]